MSHQFRNTLIALALVVILQLSGLAYIPMGQEVFIDLSLMLVVIVSLAGNLRAALIINFGWWFLQLFIAPGTVIYFPMGLLAYALQRNHPAAIVLVYSAVNLYLFFVGAPYLLLVEKWFLECVFSIIVLYELKRQLGKVSPLEKPIRVSKSIFVFEEVQKHD